MAGGGLPGEEVGDSTDSEQNLLIATCLSEKGKLTFLFSHNREKQNTLDVLHSGCMCTSSKHEFFPQGSLMVLSCCPSPWAAVLETSPPQSAAMPFTQR